MSKHPLLTIGLLLLLASSCKKDDPEASLPPATQEGKNTAGCLVNGQAFVAKAYGGGILSAPIAAMDGGFSFDSIYHLAMHAQFNGKGVEVMLFLKGDRTGTYLLNQNTRYYPQATPRYVLNHATYSTYDGVVSEVFVTSAQHTGQVVLTKSNVQQSLSAGTFSFTAANTQDASKTVTITNGRFDRKQ